MSWWQLPSMKGKLENMMRERFGNTSEDAQKALFRAYDRNGDDKISVEELQRLIRDLGYRDSAEISGLVNDIMNLAGSNRDLYISWENLKAKLRWHD